MGSEEDGPGEEAEPGFEPSGWEWGAIAAASAAANRAGFESVSMTKGEPAPKKVSERDTAAAVDAEIGGAYEGAADSDAGAVAEVATAEVLRGGWEALCFAVEFLLIERTVGPAATEFRRMYDSVAGSFSLRDGHRRAAAHESARGQAGAAAAGSPGGGRPCGMSV